MRHFEDADHLAKGERFDGAGYLIGYAVECAIKHAIEAMRPVESAPHVHLPHLVERAKKALQGRRKHSIFSVLQRPSFMVGWSVDARYCADGATGKVQFETWREDANRAMSGAGLRRSPR